MIKYNNPMRVSGTIPYLPSGEIDNAALNDWLCYNDVVVTNDFYNLRLFRSSNGDKESILMLPPNAGHTATIVDYDINKSLVECAMKNTDKNIYVLEWKSATKSRTPETYSDIINSLNDVIDFIGTEVHLVGLCQGGTVCTVYTALHPNKVKSLTVAGAPIDVQCGGVLDEAINKPMILFVTAVAASGWMMTGQAMLNCWMSANPKRHFVDRFLEPLTYRKCRFDSWYYHHVQNLSGAWYLDVVKNLFKGNKLVRGEWEVCGTKVKLSNIKCPLNLVVGTRDDISPPEHTLNLSEYVSTSYKDIKEYSGEAGHISVFMGGKMVKNCWTQLFKDM